MPTTSPTKHAIKRILSTIKYKLDSCTIGHHAAKQAILELILKWIQSPTSSGTVIGLCGATGTGKTLFAQSLASSLELPITTINLSTVTSHIDLVGCSSSHPNSHPGILASSLIEMNSNRSIIFLDELDKVPNTSLASVTNALIHLTDPLTNSKFQDHYLNTTLDFSGCLIIFAYQPILTSTSPSSTGSTPITNPLLMQHINEITMPSYDTNTKIAIANKHLISNICQDYNINPNNIQISNTTIQHIITNYTNEQGTKSLKQHLERVISHYNLNSITALTNSKSHVTTITPETIAQILLEN